MRRLAEAWPDPETVQQLLHEAPWFHLCTLLDEVKEPALRDDYLRAAIEHNWSRAVLVHHIELRTVERQGRALTNFAAQLPKPQSHLARESLKDPYRYYQLVESLPPDLEASLPSIEQIERELEDTRSQAPSETTSTSSGKSSGPAVSPTRSRSSSSSLSSWSCMLDISEAREEKKAQRTKKKDWPRIFPADNQAQ